jgi:hypothetical protein
MNRKANYSYDTLPREEDGHVTPRPVPAKRRLCKATTFAMMFAFAIFFSLLAISKYVMDDTVCIQSVDTNASIELSFLLNRPNAMASMASSARLAFRTGWDSTRRTTVYPPR